MIKLYDMAVQCYSSTGVHFKYMESSEINGAGFVGNFPLYFSFGIPHYTFPVEFPLTSVVSHISVWLEADERPSIPRQRSVTTMPVISVCSHLPRRVP